MAVAAAAGEAAVVLTTAARKQGTAERAVSEAAEEEGLTAQVLAQGVLEMAAQAAPTVEVEAAAMAVTMRPLQQEVPAALTGARAGEDTEAQGQLFPALRAPSQA